jgi:acetyl-CoA C-acetyltransferase
MADAQMTWAEIDAVVIGKAPDTLEGMMCPELYLADALVFGYKPVVRAYTSGNAGGVAATTGASLIGSGVHRRVLVVAYEKQSDGSVAGSTLQHYPFEARWQGGTGTLFAGLCREYIDRTSAPSHIGDVVALKDRRNALQNEFAHGLRPDLTLEDIAASRMLWDPIRVLHSSPSSDGACALVMAAETSVGTHHRPAWVHGHAIRNESSVSPRFDNVDPRSGRLCAKSVYAQASISDPRSEIDVAELFVPYSWLEPVVMENVGLAEEGGGWRLCDEGGTARSSSLPVNPSGGLLGANPIGAAGLIRFAEAAMQVTATAGEHQIDGARRAMGHAAGGFNNCFAMWVVGSERP